MTHTNGTRRKLEEALARDDRQTLEELARQVGVSRGRVAQLLDALGFVHDCRWVRSGE
jgi:predicted ArsR family transcriptional regulator